MYARETNKYVACLRVMGDESEYYGSGITPAMLEQLDQQFAESQGRLQVNVQENPEQGVTSEDEEAARIRREWNLKFNRLPPKEPVQVRGGLHESSNIISALNQEQISVVRCDPKVPLMVLAGPGTGKTLTLTCRIANFIALNIDPQHILALTFTRKASKELKYRVCKIIGPEGEGVTVCNFHQLCLKILRKYPQEALRMTPKFKIISQKAAKGFIRRYISEYMDFIERKSGTFTEQRVGINDSHTPFRFQKGGTSLRKIEPEMVDNMYTFVRKAKSQNNRPADFSGEYKYIYGSYLKKMREDEAIELGDFVSKVINLFKSNEAIRREYSDLYSFVLCDEFQDTSEEQMELLHLLCRDNRSLTVVGDDDQSIYSWRGANIWNFSVFDDIFPERCLQFLVQNYRSTKKIVEVSSTVISRNHCRKDKRLWTSNAEGVAAAVLPCNDVKKEADSIASEIARLHADGVQYSDMAILARMNKSLKELEAAMRIKNIPCQRKGGRQVYDLKECKDILAYVRVLADPSDIESFSRAINTPNRGVTKPVIQMIVECARIEQTGNLANATKKCVQNGFKGKYLSEKHRNGCLSFLNDMGLIYTNLFRNGGDLTKLIQCIVDETCYLQKTRVKKSPGGLDSDISTDDEFTSNRLHSLNALKQEAGTFFHSLRARGKVPDPVFLLESYIEMVDLSASPSNVAEEEVRQTRDSLTLTTIHQAKGLEWKFVFVVCANEGFMPFSNYDEDAPLQLGHIEEERRLFFVALSRAKEKLYISFSKYGESGRHLEPSRFLDEMGLDDEANASTKGGTTTKVLQEREVQGLPPTDVANMQSSENANGARTQVAVCKNDTARAIIVESANIDATHEQKIHVPISQGYRADTSELVENTSVSRRVRRAPQRIVVGDASSTNFEIDGRLMRQEGRVVRRELPPDAAKRLQVYLPQSHHQVSRPYKSANYQISPTPPAKQGVPLGTSALSSQDSMIQVRNCQKRKRRNVIYSDDDD